MSRALLSRIILRTLVVVMAVLAAADIRLRVGRGSPAAIAVIDVSESVGAGRPALPRWLDVDPNWVLVADGTEVIVGQTEPARLHRGSTHLGAGLRLAASRAPGRDVVVLTDGRGTEGDTLAGARAVREAGGRVFARPPVRPIADVGIESARLLDGGSGIRVAVDVVSSTSGHAVLSLARGERNVGRVDVVLTPGFRRRIELRDPTPPAPGARWRVRIQVGDDTPDDDSGNNALTIGWQGTRREVLVIGGLDARGYADETLGVRHASRLSPGHLAGVDLVVIANAPWRDLASGMSALEAHVEGGGQLLILGGPNAYGPGGWAGKAIDRLSPLRVEPPPGEGVLLVLLVDKSGSTADGALAHLKSASRSALLGLREGERVGVLAFDARPADDWVGGAVVEANDAKAADAALTALESLGASGPTDLPLALEHAIDRASAIPAETRLVMLLTDGDPDHRLDPVALAALRQRFDEQRIDFGALVVGDVDAADALRKALARRPEDVELLRNAERFGARLRALVRQRRMRRELLPRPERVESVGAQIPELDLANFAVGSVHDLDVADDATVMARAVWPMSPAVPFLARRTAGVGSVVGFAWGPGLEPDMAARRIATEALALLIRRLASDADRGLAAEAVGDEIIVRLPAVAGSGALPILRGDRRGRLVEREPGLFRGTVPVGAGTLRVEIPSEPPDIRPLRLPVRPPPEHRGVGVDEAALARIARAGGGVRLGADERLPKRPQAPGQALAPWLLLLSGILLVIERAVSRRARPTDAGAEGEA